MAATMLGLEKKPVSYGEYRTTLDARNQLVAKAELHEDDHTRGPALAQMREFIAKHPQIVRTRTDALFLLRFLRVRKFNVVSACEMLERWFAVTGSAKEFFSVHPDRDAALVDKCAIVPLGRDGQDRFVISIRLGQFDPQTVSPEEEIRLFSLVLETFIEEEAFQVNGMVALMDFSGATMAHFGVWTLPKLKLIMSATNDILPIRLKEVHILKVPKYASVLVDFCIATLKPKLQKRLKFHKSLEELQAAVDKSVLPTIYGGTQSLEEANEKFRKRIAQERDRIMMQANMKIDLTIPNPNAKSGANAALQSSVVDESVIGSFRKLNVD